MTIDISIGIPAHNEEENIGKLLDNLFAQALPRSFRIKEIIVVLSGCTDNTPRIVNEYARKYGIIKVIVEEERRGKWSAINKIIENSSGDVLVILAADIRLSKFLLYELVKSYLRSGRSIVMSERLPVRGSGLAYIVSKLYLYMFRYFLLGEEEAYSSASYLHGECILVPREIYERIRLPKDVILDDGWLSLYARENKIRIIYSEKAVVYLGLPSNIIEIFSHRMRDHRGHLQLKKISGLKLGTIRASVGRRKMTLLLKSMINAIAQVCREDGVILTLPAFLALVMIDTAALAISKLSYKEEEIGAYCRWRMAKSSKVIGG